MSLFLFEILHNKCIDDELMTELLPKDIKLMNFLHVKKNEKGTFAEDYSNGKQKIKDNRKSADVQEAKI